MLQFEDFLSIVNSLFSNELAAQYLHERRARFDRDEMVFGDFTGGGGGLDNRDNNQRDEASRIQALRTANCIKILGKGVIRVVHRVDDARENNALDLSDCQLMQIPDAVYFMMRNTSLLACNLSSNVISKIPPKFPTKFSLITELNLSSNRISTLPDEIAECTQLEKVDISQNSFLQVPNCLLSLPALVRLNARNNFIADVDIEMVEGASNTLEYLNLEENPLTRETQEALASFNTIRIMVTPREMEEWEDLSI